MKAKKVLGRIVLVIVLLNAVAYAYTLGFNPPIYREGRIIKFKPLGYAMVFAHGNYGKYLYENTTYHCHATSLGGHNYCTKYLLDELWLEGYDKVWLSQCHTGDSKYMYWESEDWWGLETTYREEWYDWVSRNEDPGKTWPIFIGVGMVRVSSNNGKIGFG